VTVLDAARQDQSLHGFVVLVVDDDSAAIEVVSDLVADDFGCLALGADSAIAFRMPTRPSTAVAWEQSH